MRRMDQAFNLREELAAYCVSDVDILTHAAVACREIFMTITHFDVFQQCITLASVCMDHYRTSHLKAKHLGLVREMGYEKHDNQSELALKYLRWWEEENPDVEVQHRNNRVRSFWRPINWTAMCRGAHPSATSAWRCTAVLHGCPKCFPGKC